MIWLAWRQFRIQAIAGATLLALLVGGLLLTWSQVRNLALSTGYTDCADDAYTCISVGKAFLHQLEERPAGQVYLGVTSALFVMPALVGVFWGAPLVARELEHATHRMVWSQSVSRRRWLLVKLAVGGLSAALGAGVLGLLLTTWAQPIDNARQNLITPLVFPARGVVPIGYATLAFVLGVTTGLVLRRTLAAMAVTLLLVVAVQVGAVTLRPLIAQPEHTVTALTAERLDMVATRLNGDIELVGFPAETDSWVLSNKVVATAGGPEFHGPVDQTKCGSATGAFDGCRQWVVEQGLLQEESYVPAKRFWAVQWRELGLLITLAAALSLFSLWWIRRRLA